MGDHVYIVFGPDPDRIQIGSRSDPDLDPDLDPIQIGSRSDLDQIWIRIASRSGSGAGLDISITKTKIVMKQVHMRAIELTFDVPSLIFQFQII